MFLPSELTHHHHCERTDNDYRQDGVQAETQVNLAVLINRLSPLFVIHWNHSDNCIINHFQIAKQSIRIFFFGLSKEGVPNQDEKDAKNNNLLCGE